MRPVIELQVPARQDPESNPYWKGNLIWVPLAGRHLFELRTGGVTIIRTCEEQNPGLEETEKDNPRTCV
jgi:hypothetical protein